MPLSQGTFLGPYEISGAVGAGAMGEVYRARDTKLQRDVAIKVLPDLVAQDPERLARFGREAQVLAALNHPNIAHIHGVLENPTALVMEFVPGEDLQERIAAGPVPFHDALPIAKQIAEALEAAHERGIVHRDLKPANVKVAPDGTVKVLDFGLARAIDGGSVATISSTDSPTLTSPAMTRMGVVMGTAAYMSPEQARGKAADRRSDIWAFGCVLYEMLTATRAFGGDTVTDTLSAIVSQVPQWSRLPLDTPSAVRTLLQRCLEKDPRKRLQAIGEARVVLEDPGSGERPEAAQPRRFTVGPAVAAALVVGGLAAGSLAVLTFARRPSTPVLSPHLALPLAPAEGLAGGFTLSPDGSKVAFVGVSEGRSQIFIKGLDRDDATVLAGTEGIGIAPPVFSPDGRWVVFSAAGVLKKAAVDGAQLITLTNDGGSANTRPFWSADDTIIFSNRSLGLSRVPAGGGESQILTTPDNAHGGEMTHEMPWVLPGTRTLLFAIRRGGAPIPTIAAQSLDGGERRELFPGVVLGSIGPDRLVVQRSEEIVSIPFDSGRLVATGTPTTLITPLPSTQNLGFGTIPLFAVAPNGTMVYQRSRPGDDGSPLMLTDRAGAAVPVALPAHRYSDPRVSPDGGRIAVHLFEEGRDNWVADLRRATLTKLTFDPGEDETPVWSADGRWIFWTSTRGKLNRAIYRKAADGTGGEQVVWSGDSHLHIGSVTRDGKTLIISMIERPATNIYTVDVATGTAAPIVKSGFNAVGPALSPDGKWLAYASDESGENEVYVQPFPSLQTRTQVSAGGGMQPVWSRNSNELFYRGRGKIMAVAFAAGDTFVPSSPKPLFDDTFFSTQGAGHTAYDVTPDGRFLMVGNPNASQGPIRYLAILYRP